MAHETVPHLQAVQEAFAFREWVGGEDAISNYTYSLSRWGAGYLVRIWGTEMLAPHSMQAVMHNVRVPINSTDACRFVGKRLYSEYGIYGQRSVLFACSCADLS